MKLDGLELLLVDLSMRRPLETAREVHGDRPLLVVRLRAEGLEGWGECGALAAGTSVDPGVAEVRAVLGSRAAPRLLEAVDAGGGHLPPAASVARLAGSGAAARMAGAALEMAVLDLELRASGTSLGARLGVSRPEVAVGAVAGIPAGERMDVLLGSVEELVARGFQRVRLKIRPGWDEQPVRAVRERHPDLALQVDANGAYRLGSDGDDGAHHLAGLDPFGLVCVEQPLAPGDLGPHARLAQVIRTPVCLDESLGSPGQVVEAIRARALAVACLKPARLGGLFAARAALDRCARAGLGSFVGGFFEAGLGRSANLAFAALEGVGLPGDLSDPADYLDEDPFGYPGVTGGLVAVPGAPGVGRPPDPDALDRRVRVRRWFPAPR